MGHIVMKFEGSGVHENQDMAVKRLMKGQKCMQEPTPNGQL